MSIPSVVVACFHTEVGGVARVDGEVEDGRAVAAVRGQSVIGVVAALGVGLSVPSIVVTGLLVEIMHYVREDVDDAVEGGNPSVLSLHKLVDVAGHRIVPRRVVGMVDRVSSPRGAVAEVPVGHRGGVVELEAEVHGFALADGVAIGQLRGGDVLYYL